MPLAFIVWFNHVFRFTGKSRDYFWKCYALTKEINFYFSCLNMVFVVFGYLLYIVLGEKVENKNTHY